MSLVQFDVIAKPTVAPPAVNLAPEKVKPRPVAPEAHKVFGITKQTITDEGQGESIKQGNTIAKAPDEEKLRPGDSEALPIPTDEFLVTAMPELVSDVRVPYPSEAKAKGLAGPVVMELLIDTNGQVRQVSLVSGPDPLLNDAALKAAEGFKFKPAKVKDQIVAVKIRYTYRFVLEK